MSIAHRLKIRINRFFLRRLSYETCNLVMKSWSTVLPTLEFDLVDSIRVMKLREDLIGIQMYVEHTGGNYK